MINRRHIAAAAATAVAGLVVASGPALAGPAGDLTPGQRDALAAGVQVAPKGATAGAKSTAVQPNPYLAQLPDATTIDYTTWREAMARDGRARAKGSTLKSVQKAAAAATTARAVRTIVHDEEEPAGTSGANDTRENAEPIAGFGTGAKQASQLRILGSMPDLAPTATALAPVAEDNGSIPLAGNTGITGSGARTTTGQLGDGPHGSAGDGTNDFDFYKLTVNAGNTILVDTSASAATADTIVAVYSSTGERLAVDDDSGPGFTSVLSWTAPATATYYAMVAGYAIPGSFPRDPMDSGSGFGGATEPAYSLRIAAFAVDHDFYSFALKPGDVVGGTVTGSSRALTLYRPDGVQMMGTDQDASSLYPPTSPLPGGGNAVLAYVAESAGQYVLELGSGVGAYDVTVNGFRPGSEIDPSTRTQTVFLDFDGATVNTAIWGGPGVRTLSPFGSFVAKWGLTRAQEGALIDAITAEVTENIKQDLRAVNSDVRVKVLNSKDHADPFGKENVSRVIVGGTIAQSGISTIGIAQFIDPGNYGHEDSAVVLLDVLSDPSGPASLNTYLNAGSDRVGFVSQAVGNVIAHEVGHMIGNYHTDNANPQHSLMDAGGTGFGNLFGVGPDNVGGTADDEDVDFALDDYIPAEGFTGKENTLNVAAWAYTAPR